MTTNTVHAKAYIDKKEYVSNSYLPVEESNSAIESLALKLKAHINDLSDTIGRNRKCWFISADGCKNNSGETPESAWDSTETLNANKDKIKPGDAVLFKRGDCFRGFIESVSGVSYGAFGEGSKPRLYGSIRNYINDNWIEVQNGLWTVDAEFPADVGNIIFDGGSMVGAKCINKCDIANEFDFWCDHDDGNRIYIKLNFDPCELFNEIEIAFNLWMFRIEEGNHDIEVENLCFKYCGGHGIRASQARNITVRGCEFEFIGGSFLSGYRDGTVRYGNSIEFMNGCCNILVENCYMSQIYDSGITNQGCGLYCAENLQFKNNLIEYCGMGSIEYWLGDGSKCKDVFYSGNIMRFAGYGFGGIQRPDKNMTAHIQSNGKCHNNAENFRIEKNIFELSKYDLINAQSLDGTVPVLSDNVYIQTEGGRLGSYSDYKDCICGKELLNTLRTCWGDFSASISLSH